MTYQSIRTGDLVEAAGYYGIVVRKYKICDTKAIDLYWFLCSQDKKDSLIKIPQFVTVFNMTSIRKLSLIDR